MLAVRTSAHPSAWASFAVVNGQENALGGTPDEEDGVREGRDERAADGTMDERQ